MSKTQDLEIDRKTTKAYELRFTKNCTPLDITGWIIYFTVKKNMKDSDTIAVIKKDLTIHSDPSNGKTLLELTADDTDLVGSFYYDIKYQDTTGGKDIIIKGRLKINESVTQRA